jgi:VanZ family protein
MKTVRRTRYKIIKSWLLVLFWAGFIFFISHQSDLGLGLSENWSFLFSYLAHFLEYTILTFLLIAALQEHRLARKTVLILAVIFALAYAFSDEYHQSFIPGRQASGQDILIDGLAVFLVAWLSKGKVIK